MAENARLARESSRDVAPFPREVAEFGDDERISYSKVDAKWILEDEADREWEFNEISGHWMEKIDEEDIRRYQAAYGAASPTDEATVEPKASENKNKRKASDQQAKKSGEKVQENRAIYVTGIPQDAQLHEIEEIFTRYGGLIAEGDNDRKRITMYRDEDGDFKGEALIVYFRPESVLQAINLLHDAPFRPDAKSGNMTVQPADMSYKKVKTASTGPALKGNDKRKLVKKNNEMQARLAEWSDDEPSTIPAVVSKWDKVVILKHMFRLEELEKDAAAYLDIKEEVREEASKCGEVTNVVLYDKEPEGVMTVRFKDAADAQKFVHKTDGRFFGGLQAESWIAESRPRFKKSGRGTESDQEEEAERLEKFGQELEAEARAEAAKSEEVGNGKKEE